MINKLKSRYFSEHISISVWNSRDIINSNEFEYVESFEKLCLKEFDLFKTAYSSLSLSEQDEVIKHWTNKFESIEDNFYEFAPFYFKSFNLATYYEIDVNDQEYDFVDFSDKEEIFYRIHYSRKFEYLIVKFLKSEENHLIEKLLNSEITKGDFNPLEILNIELPKETYIKKKKKDLLLNVSQKDKGHLFCLFKELKIKVFHHNNIEAYCEALCLEYDTRYSDQIRQNFNLDIHKTYRETFKQKVVSLLPEDQKSKIEQHLNSM